MHKRLQKKLIFRGKIPLQMLHLQYKPKTTISECKPAVPRENQHHCEIYEEPNKYLNIKASVSLSYKNTKCIKDCKKADLSG